MSNPRDILNTLVNWAVLGWMASHTICWALVEMLRLGRATYLKIRHIFASLEAEE